MTTAQQIINQSKPEKFTAKDWKKVYQGIDRDLRSGDIFTFRTFIYFNDSKLTKEDWDKLRKKVRRDMKKEMKHGRN